MKGLSIIVDYIEYSKQTTVKGALGTLYDFISCMARKGGEEEVLVGELLALMIKIIALSDYVKENEPDQAKIKELVHGIPQAKDLSKSFKAWKEIHKR